MISSLHSAEYTTPLLVALNMQSRTAIVCLNLAATFVSALPSQIGAAGTFSVTQVAVNGSGYVVNGPKQYLKSLGKYHANIPTAVQEAAVGRARPLAAASSGGATTT